MVNLVQGKILFVKGVAVFQTFFCSYGNVHDSLNSIKSYYEPLSTSQVSIKLSTCVLQIIIVAPDTLVRCADLVVGEIWLHSGSKAGGYFGKPEETQATFHAVPVNGEGLEHGGYLRTGDMGFIHEGQLYITGRLKVIS